MRKDPPPPQKKEKGGGGEEVLLFHGVFRAADEDAAVSFFSVDCLIVNHSVFKVSCNRIILIQLA